MASGGAALGVTNWPFLHAPSSGIAPKDLPALHSALAEKMVASNFISSPLSLGRLGCSLLLLWGRKMGAQAGESQQWVTRPVREHLSHAPLSKNVIYMPW